MKFLQKGLKSLALTCLLANLSFSDTINQVRADQPVHCLREELFGEWIFHVTKDKQTLNLFETQQICSHAIPNKIQLVNKAHKFDFDGADSYKVNILKDFKAEAVFCKDGKTCESKLIKGKWSMIYDQAFIVELDNGTRFLSNFRYNIKDTIAKDPLSEAGSNGITKFATIESGDQDKFDSQCNESMVGFIQNIPGITGKQETMTQHTAQCFHGVRAHKYNYEETKEVHTPKMKENIIIAHHDDVKTVNLLDDKNTQSKAQKSEPKIVKTKAKKRANMHLEHKPSDEMDLMISEINDADLGWKADTCKYQKNHELYGKHCDKPVTLAQTGKNEDLDGLMEELAEAENKPKFGDLNNPDFVKSLENAQKFQKEYKDAQKIPDNMLPETYDMRNLDGFDYTSEFRDQGHCGSCYTVSFIQVAEARLKLKYGKQPPPLSPQYMMTCNYMNEGCDGGWPHFNVFLAQNGHMVSEECSPYKGKTKGDQCGNYKACEPISKVQESYFVGGTWGSTTEKKMMKEILRNGAINGDFQAPSMFSVYKEGIFSEKGMVHLHQSQQNRLLEMIGLAQTESSETSDSDKKAEFSDKSINDAGKVSWMDMNHSVVIVGWGKDKKTNTKYWIVRNSYGPQWGMEGDFLVKRGGNDFGMEVEQIAFHPVLCGEDGAVCQ